MLVITKNSSVFEFLLMFIVIKKIVTFERNKNLFES